MPGFLAAVPFGKPGWREYSRFAALPQDGLEEPPCANLRSRRPAFGVNLPLDTAHKPCEIRMMRPPHKKRRDMLVVRLALLATSVLAAIIITGR
ncbi:hypothetical protein LMTR3_10565 [Bradyrhizobium sp. LMTR 3]|nr:hypothetical protein LMTR3_10565 [Bradyrhizobium sp. LMTR 3]